MKTVFFLSKIIMCSCYAVVSNTYYYYSQEQKGRIHRAQIVYEPAKRFYVQHLRSWFYIKRGIMCGIIY